MKNIYTLPTNKPSYLYKMHDGILRISDLFEAGNSACKNQNIYITSDEEIKEGDWVLTILHNKIEQVLDNKTSLKYYQQRAKKIILTTDLGLQKDGVQPIDYEFLEWFCSQNGKVNFVEVIAIEDEKN